MVRLYSVTPWPRGYESVLVVCTNDELHLFHPICLFYISKIYLSGLFYLLGDEGDACLIPAPYYAAFENDMRIVAKIVPFAVQMANPIQGPSASELDLAYIEAKSVSFIYHLVVIL